MNVSPESVVFWCSVVATLTACGGVTQQGALGRAVQGAPNWVLGDCLNEFRQDEVLLCAVGEASGTSNIAAARSMAETRASARLTVKIEQMVDTMREDYLANTTDFVGISDEQAFAEVTDILAEGTLRGARSRETWISNDGNTLFVLLAVDASTFADYVNGMEQLSPEAAAAIQERAQSARDRREQRQSEEGIN